GSTRARYATRPARASPRRRPSKCSRSSGSCIRASGRRLIPELSLANLPDGCIGTTLDPVGLEGKGMTRFRALSVVVAVLLAGATTSVLAKEEGGKSEKTAAEAAKTGGKTAAEGAKTGGKTAAEAAKTGGRTAGAALKLAGDATVEGV